MADNKTARLRSASKAIVLLTGVLWLVYDFIPVANPGRGDTISENMRDWSRAVWVLPLFWGSLTSHLFINVGQPGNYKQLFYAYAAVMVAGVTMNLVTHFAFDWQAAPMHRALLLVAGACIGVLLWGQNP